MIDLEEILNDDLADEPMVQLDYNLVLSKIPSFDSNKLCEMIVCNRYFGLHDNITIVCMQELATRRQNGDQFNFEQNINLLTAEMPALNTSLPDIKSILTIAINSRLS